MARRRVAARDGHHGSPGVALAALRARRRARLASSSTAPEWSTVQPWFPAPTGATPAARPTRDSATLAVLRDGPQGIEVLLLQRAERGDHNSGAWVFPGG